MPVYASSLTCARTSTYLTGITNLTGSLQTTEEPTLLPVLFTPSLTPPLPLTFHITLHPLLISVVGVLVPLQLISSYPIVVQPFFKNPSGLLFLPSGLPF